MKKFISLFFVGMLLSVCLVGCGGSDNSSQPAPKESTITFLTKTSRMIQVTADEKGNLEKMRVGGIEIKKVDVDYFVFTSYRFGGINTSPYKVSMNDSMLLVFTDLPNNDQWMELRVVLKSGKDYLVELSKFKVVDLAGLYEWIDPSSSSLEYGDIEAAASQDWMHVSVDEATMVATVEGQFGCNLIFATEAGSFNYQPGMGIGIEDGNGVIYAGNILQDADGNLSYTISGIPVVPGPYYDRYDGNPIPVATIIKDVFVIMPSGEKVSLNTWNNTPDDSNETIYRWYIGSDYNTPNGATFYVAQEEGRMMFINYQPAWRN